MAVILRRPLALADVEQVWEYIAADSERFADEWLDSADERLVFLSANFDAGRERSELAAAVRSLTLGNYVLYYRPVADGVELVRVLHGARDVRGGMLE